MTESSPALMTSKHNGKTKEPVDMVEWILWTVKLSRTSGKDLVVPANG